MNVDHCAIAYRTLGNTNRKITAMPIEQLCSSREILLMNICICNVLSKEIVYVTNRLWHLTPGS